MTFLCVAIPAALIGVLLAAVFRRFSPHEGVNAIVPVVLLQGRARNLQQCFYGHVPVVLLFAAFALLLSADGTLSRARLWLLGALFGAALLMEYPAAMVVAALGRWTLAPLAYREMAAPWLAGPRRGAVTRPARPLRSCGVWDAPADRIRTFDALARSPRRRLPQPDLSQAGCIMGYYLRRLSWPLLSRAHVVSRDPWFGGLVADGARSGGVVGRGLLHGGVLPLRCRIGDVVGRFRGRAALSPADAPVLLLPDRALIPLFERWRIAVAGARELLSFVQVWTQLLAGQGYPPETLPHPLTQYVWPRLGAGDIARNLGMAIGLHSL